ncbi:MAG TPA: hypothetical protein PLD20_30155 [Blastocatellia bacterium]|nr:hypothetical protein [Blastocatellia bacterium]HMV85353.1 hypothetical protein [Blastocatellia bacterium]HMZ22234.1 hypothetical protein [Blastocatellia bacterium]HNG30088.1 hypothetical protein [Blastocatellia bacterium]
MSDKDIFSERERGMETEYFLKREQELIAKMRERVAREEERRQMAEAIGVADEEVLEALQDLGYHADTVKLLSVIPLVQVAWAEGGVSDAERELIYEVAAARGITEGTTAYDKLNEWLASEPPQAFFENSLRAVNYLFESLPEDQRALSRQSLVEYCTQIAEVSGGILGFRKISDEERMAIARIASEIGQSRPNAVKQVIAS